MIRIKDIVTAADKFSNRLNMEEDTSCKLNHNGSSDLIRPTLNREDFLSRFSFSIENRLSTEDQYLLVTNLNILTNNGIDLATHPVPSLFEMQFQLTEHIVKNGYKIKSKFFVDDILDSFMTELTKYVNGKEVNLKRYHRLFTRWENTARPLTVDPGPYLSLTPDTVNHHWLSTINGIHVYGTRENVEALIMELVNIIYDYNKQKQLKKCVDSYFQKKINMKDEFEKNLLRYKSTIMKRRVNREKPKVKISDELKNKVGDIHPQNLVNQQKSINTLNNEVKRKVESTEELYDNVMANKNATDEYVSSLLSMFDRRLEHIKQQKQQRIK